MGFGILPSYALHTDLDHFLELNYKLFLLPQVMFQAVHCFSAMHLGITTREGDILREAVSGQIPMTAGTYTIAPVITATAE